MKLNKVAAKVKKNLSKFVAHRKSANMGDAGSSKGDFDALEASQSAIRMRSILERFHYVCRGCQGKIEVDDGSWDQHIAKWLAGAKKIPPSTQISMLECVKCDGTITCVGCGGEPNISQDGNHWTPLGVVNHCCDGGRLFGIWLLLCRFDKEVSSRVTTSQSSPTPTSKVRTTGERKLPIPNSHIVSLQMRQYPKSNLTQKKQLLTLRSSR
jgi:baculoviral IAP repeat-containing protein 6